MARCTNCGNSYNQEDYKYCLHCGSVLVLENDLPTISIPSVRPVRSGQIKEKASNVINFDRSSNRGVVANELTVKMTTKAVKLNPPSGIIASDSNMRAYAKYLIERYHQFKKADRNISEMRYSAIYSSIKKEFKCSWDYVPMDKFDALVKYLQNRIDNTILGKNQKKQGKVRYETYKEWLTTR